MDYLRIDIFQVQKLPIDIYLYFLREAYITNLKSTKEGKEYLHNCWRIEQTEPERQKIRENLTKRG